MPNYDEMTIEQLAKESGRLHEVVLAAWKEMRVVHDVAERKRKLIPILKTPNDQTVLRG